MVSPPHLPITLTSRLTCCIRFFYVGLGCQREMFSMICECSLHSNGTQLPPKPLAVSTKGSAPMAELGGDNMWIVPVQGVTGKLTLAPPASTRSRGRDQPAVGGVPTLCDRVNGWVYECAGSNSSICYGFFGLPRRTCTDWCSDAGLICIAGADDNTRVRASMVQLSLWCC